MIISDHPSLTHPPFIKTSERTSVAISEQTSLGSLPLELVSHIASFACTDGGRTGGILSTVSSHVANATEPYRFQSVALSGHIQMERFYSTITAMPTHRRCVRDLYLCDQREEDWMSVMNSPTDPLCETFDKLFHLLAPHLESLTCVIFGVVHSDLLIPLLACLWPSLTSLTLRLAITQLPSLAPSALDSRMPRLRHLTYAIVHDLVDWPSFLSALLSACPSLDQLDLADVSTRTALVVALVVSGHGPTKPLPPFLGPIATTTNEELQTSQLLANSDELDALRPRTGMRVRVRVEALLEEFAPLRYASEDDRRGFAEAIGCAAYRAVERNEQEWKDAWVARPDRIF